MTLIKYKPSRKNTLFPSTILNDFLNFDDFFSKDLGKTFGVDNYLNSPSVNIVKIENGFQLDVAAPGLAKDDFNIEIEKDQLIISAEQKTENEEQKDEYTRREFNYNSFKRSFHLDEKIDQENISAKYNQGVLSITLPKVTEADLADRKKKIDIS